MFDFWSDLVCLYFQIAGCRGCRLRKRKVLHPQVVLQVLRPLNLDFPRVCLCDSRFRCFSFSFFPLFFGEENFSPLSRREVLSQCSLAPAPSYYAPFFSPLPHPFQFPLRQCKTPVGVLLGSRSLSTPPTKGLLLLKLYLEQIVLSSRP